jgi:hypothetical protein
LDRRNSSRLSADVVVVGGGAAGVATAVTAGRAGLKAVLVERYGFCGGGAVAGLSGTICGLYSATNGRQPEQVVFGFAETFVQALAQRGGLAAPVVYGKTLTRVHDPMLWRETADALLASAGVKVIFHATCIGVLTEGDEAVQGVMLSTKQGPLRIDARVVVDASGDADLIAMAGLPSVIGDEGRVQNPTMIFRLGGVDIARFRAAYGEDTIMPPAIADLMERAEASGRYHLPRRKIWLFPTTHPDVLLCNCTRITGADGRELMTLDADDFTEAEIEGRKQARSYARFFRESLTGCEQSYLIDTGVQVGIRQTRQVDGVARLMNADVISGRKDPDGIVRCPWPIELHQGAKPKVEWLIDDYYDVPFDTLKPRRGEGLLVAGRCLSAEHEAIASARVTAQCFGYGHAVGHAAVLAVREGVDLRKLQGRDLRMILNRDGARLDG